MAQGFLHAVMLPHAMKFNLPATRAWQELLSKAIVDGLPAGMAPARLDDASALVAQFRDCLGLPRRLRELNIPASELGLVADDAFMVWHTHFNPRRVESPEELREVLAGAW